MASISAVFLALILLVSATFSVDGQGIPVDAKKQPQFLGQFDGTVLIPGLGRYMVPKKGQNLLHYNPITGAPTGHGVSIPDIAGSTGISAPRHYIPGGDDTLLPNPGVEVPIPGGGGGFPAMPSHP